MAKNKNIVGRAVGRLCGLLILLAAAGWLLAAGTILVDRDQKAQEALAGQAARFIEDKLYIRAASCYQKAIEDYQTEKNGGYEKALLDVYREGNMTEEYYELIEDRIGRGAAGQEEYQALAGAYLEEGAEKEAAAVLKQGLSLFDDRAMRELYESVRYRYKPSTALLEETKMPSEDWYVPAFNGERWGYVDKKGRTVLDFIYEEATRFSGNYAVVKTEGTYTLIDKNGYWNAVDKNGLDQVTAISGTRIVGVKDGKYGIFTNTFSPLNGEWYDGALLSDNGIAAVKRDGKWAFLDADLNPATEFVFTDVAENSRGQVFENGCAAVADESGWYLADEKGKPCFDARFSQAKGVEGGLLAVADENGKWGFADGKGELVLDFQYEEAYSFSDSLAAVRYGGKWGYMNRYGQFAIEPQFDAALPFLAGSALAKDGQGNVKILTLSYYDLF